MSMQDSQLTLDPSGPGVEVDEGPKTVAGQSPFKLAMRRFRRDKLSMAAFVVVALFGVAAVLAPFLVHFGVLDPYSPNQKVLDVALGGTPKGSFGGVSWSHPFGVEPGTGRDALSRMWYGITFSMAVATSSAVLAVIIGTVLGIIAGLTGGKTDWGIGRVIDLTLSFPVTLMLLALSSLGIAMAAKVLPGGEADPLVDGAYIVAVLALFGWPSIARVMRGQVMTIREREFIDAAKLLGASRFRLYFREVLPNLWSPLLVYLTLTIPLYVSAAAALAYLGVGIRPPTPTLGNVLTDSINYSVADPVYFFLPAVLLALIVLSFNLFGDGLGDALDPKSDR